MTNKERKDMLRLKPLSQVFDELDVKHRLDVLEVGLEEILNALEELSKRIDKLEIEVNNIKRRLSLGD